MPEGRKKEGMGQESLKEKEMKQKRQRHIESRSQKEVLAYCYTKAGKPKEEEVGYNLQCGERRFMWP